MFDYYKDMVQSDKKTNLKAIYLYISPSVHSALSTSSHLLSVMNEEANGNFEVGIMLRDPDLFRSLCELCPVIITMVGY